MQQFVRGQRAKISAFSSAQKFEVSVVLQSSRIPVFDFVCFGVDAGAQLSDDSYMVFFNQQSAPDGVIQLLELGDQKATFSVDLAKIPASVARLVFTASVEGTGEMRTLDSGTFAMKEAEGAKASVLEYRFQGSDFATEGALMLGEIYRKDGDWRFWAQGQGFAGDLRALLKHFGGLESPESSAAPTPTPQTATGAAPVSPPPPT
ncbi:tellurium resistance protein, partial [bacterium]